jgi:hypothetical protein
MALLNLFKPTQLAIAVLAIAFVYVSSPFRHAISSVRCSH